MAVLQLDAGYRKEFERKVDTYSNLLDDIESKYSGVQGLLNKYTSSDTDVSSSCIYLTKRKKDIQAVKDRAEALKTNVGAYLENSIAKDEGLSKKIHKDSYSFYKKKGIGPQSDSWKSRAWHKIKTTGKDFVRDIKGTWKKLKSDIKDFYEAHKAVIDFVFKVIGDIVVLTAAIALFAVSGGTLVGIICLIGAIWATAKAGFNLLMDVGIGIALSEGDYGRARDLSEKSLAGEMVKGGEWLDQKFGTHFFENLTKLAIVGLETCEMAAELMLTFDTFKDIFNLKVRSDGKPLTVYDTNYKCSWKESIRNWKMHSAAGTKGMGGRFASVTNWGKFGLWTVGFKFSMDAGNLGELVGSATTGDNLKDNCESLKGYITDPSTIIESVPFAKPILDYNETINATLAM